LPVVARADPTRGAAQYGLLLGCFGVGAVLGATLLSSHVRRLGLENTVIASTVIFAATLLVLAWLPIFGLWCAVLLAAGAAWLAVLSNLNASAIAVVPAWVRARALAVYLLGFFGSMAVGSLLWGELADRLGPPLSLTLAAAWMLTSIAAAPRLRLPITDGMDLEPSRHWPEMVLESKPDLELGPMLVTVEYRVDAHHCQEFVEAMRPMRQARLRTGALRWDLFRDFSDPGRFMEVFLTESVVEHLRQHERVTEADRQIEARVHAYQRGDTVPVVTHLVGGFHQANGRCAGVNADRSELERFSTDRPSTVGRE
jgi:quinol monooxygenase YgiN